jgi:putative transposase
VFDTAVDQVLRDVCFGIEARYQLKFLEIGTDRDHVHFLVQAVPTYSVTKLVTTIKSLTASPPIIILVLWKLDVIGGLRL